MSMKNVLALAQDTMEPGDSPIGRFAATKDAGPLPDDVVRKLEGSFHPLGADAPQDW